MTAYYNEIDPFAAQWLRNLIDAKLIANGVVDERSIVDVTAEDLAGFTQCHFFAGIGGWSYALRLAGWADSRKVWTGSCPCQSFSTAGRGAGKADPRHLWPEWHRLIRESRPPTIFGEQVAAAIAHGWLDDVCQGLEGEGYACAAAVLPAVGVGRAHRRDRLWFVAHSTAEGFSHRADQEVGESGEEQVLERCRSDGPLAHTHHAERRAEMAAGDIDHGQKAGWNEGDGEFGTSSDGPLAESEFNRSHSAHRDEAEQGRDREDGGVSIGGGGELWPLGATKSVGFGQGDSLYAGSDKRSGAREGTGSAGDGGSLWDFEWLACIDGKQRPIEPSIPLLAHGISGRVGQLRGIGNAIVPQVAAEFIGAFMDCESISE